MKENNSKDFKIMDSFMHNYERIVLIDTKTEDYCTYFDCKKEFYKLSEYGVYDERIVYMKYHFVHMYDKERYESSISLNNLKEILGEEELTYHFRILNENDEYHWKCYRFKYLDDSKLTIILSVQDVQDIRLEEQKYEDSMRESLINVLGKHKESSKSRHAFSDMVTKEVRQLILTIGGESSISEEETKDISILKEKIDKIRKVSSQLLKIMDKISYMNQLDSGMLHSERVETELYPFIKTIYEGQKKKADQQKVEMIGEINPFKNRFYFVDVIHTSDIIVSALTNAIKFSKEGSKIHFTADEKKMKNGESVLCIEVDDIGVYGFSLMLCERIVELMGGSIVISNKDNGPNYFSVEIPMGCSENSEEKIVPLQSEHLKEEYPKEEKDIKIFLTETYENKYSRIGSLLQENGVKFHIVYSGSEALKLWRTSRNETYTAILVDSNLQDIPYLSLVKKLRSLEEGKSMIPIIAVGENFIIDDMKAGYQAGVNANILRTVTIEKLLEILKVMRT